MPAATTKGTAESPKGVICLATDLERAGGPEEPPLAALQDAEHHQPQPDRRKGRSDEVELLPLDGWAGLDPANAEDQDRDHDHGLGGEHDAPSPDGRHEAADQRPRRDSGAGDPSEEAVSHGPFLARVVRGGQGGDRRDHQAGAEPLDQRPAEKQDLDVRADRGDQRAGPVDAEADRKDPPAPVHVAELRAGEHERRHHERVGGDRELHLRHRRIEVGDHLGDRHVHDGGVEHHHELGGAQDQDCRAVPQTPRALARPLADRGQETTCISRVVLFSRRPPSSVTVTMSSMRTPKRPAR